MFEHRKTRFLVMALAGAPLALIAGCGGAPTPVGVGRVSPVQVSDAVHNAFSADDTQSYAIRPNDTISIAVFREPDLSVQAVQVGSDGTVSVPLLGNIKVGALTVAQTATMLEGKLGASYLRDPNVNVNVVKYGSHLVSIEGAVTNAGRFEFIPGTHLTGALAQAGGVTRTSKMQNIVIMRPDGDGLLIAKFDYRAITNGTMSDPVIQPNDRIVVGTSGLAQGYQDFLRTVPIFALFFRYF